MKTEPKAQAAPGVTPAALNLEQAAAYLGGLSTSYVRRLVSDGELTAVRSGKRLVFPIARLDAYLDANTTQPKLAAPVARAKAKRPRAKAVA